MSTCLYPFHPRNPFHVQSLFGGTPYRAPGMAAMANLRWPIGAVIRVGFLDPLDEWISYLRSAVKAFALEWTQYANLKFKFVEGLPAEVTVKFTTSSEVDYGTYCSCLGVDNCLVTPSTYLVFDPKDPGNTDTELGRVILHEFGHVLGLIHEHERPDRPLVWDRAGVIKYYQRLCDWSPEQIEAQVIAPYSDPIIDDTNFDPASIMMYPVPPGLAVTAEGKPFEVGWNLTLSARDKLIAAKMYPKTKATS